MREWEAKGNLFYIFMTSREWESESPLSHQSQYKYIIIKIHGLAQNQYLSWELGNLKLWKKISAFLIVQSHPEICEFFFFQTVPFFFM